MREARCTKCQETFNPASDNDLIHTARVDGTECGGVGQFGYWPSWHPSMGIDPPAPPSLRLVDG